MLKAVVSIVAVVLAGCSGGEGQPPPPGTASGGFDIADKVIKSDAEWQRVLDYRAYQTTRERATEWQYTGDYWDHYEEGVYRCVACGLPLFSSESKYDSGTGWPSFSGPIAEANVYTAIDDRGRAPRTELLCSRCDGHLGHLFDDGPPPSGLRYCVNSAALSFEAGTVTGPDDDKPPIDEPW